MLRDKIIDRRMNGLPMTIRAEQVHCGNIGSYTLTEEERLEVLAINEMRGTAHLVAERNAEFESMSLARKKSRAETKRKQDADKEIR